MANGLQVSADAQPYPFSRLELCAPGCDGSQNEQQAEFGAGAIVCPQKFVEESGDAHDLF